MATESTHLPGAEPVEPAHTEHASHDGVYILIYVVLVVLTGLELLATYAGIVRIPVLIALAAIKAALVAAFYMHLRYEQRYLPFVFAGPVIIGILAALAIQQLVLR